MYSRMAEWYDRLMDDVDYAAWAAYYAGLIPGAESVCECACGTGALTLELLRRGYRVTATDLSGDMLRVAEAKLRKAGLRAPLVQMDMRALALPGPVDAVICCCDGLNYLTADEDALAFLRSARESLKSGGALAFDVSTRAKLRAMDAQVYCDERDDVAYIWKNRWDGAGDLLRMELSFYEREPGGLYRRFGERHVQRGWEPEELCALLERAGYTDIRVFGDKTALPPAPGEARAHFSARKP